MKTYIKAMSNKRKLTKIEYQCIRYSTSYRRMEEILYIYSQTTRILDASYRLTNILRLDYRDASLILLSIIVRHIDISKIKLI